MAQKIYTDRTDFVGIEAPIGKENVVIVGDDGKIISKNKINIAGFERISNVDSLRLYEGEEGEFITLLGYYEQGDKSKVNYRFTETQGVDNGGSIINTENGSWIMQAKSASILDFGASPSLEDNHEFIQAAFSSDIFEIIFPDGTFEVSEELYITENKKLIGSENFLLTVTDDFANDTSSSLINIDTDSITIEGLNIDCDEVITGIYVVNASFVNIKKVRIDNSNLNGSNAITIENSSDITVKKTRINGSGNHGIRTLNCNNILITENILKDIDTDGISLKNSTQCVVTNNIIDDFVLNPFTGGGRGGIHIYQSPVDDIYKDVIVSGNILNTTSPLGECNGIRIRSSASNINIENNIVNNNNVERVFQDSSTGIKLEPSDSANDAFQEKIIVSGNEVSGWIGTASVMIRARSFVDKFIVTNNIITKSLVNGIFITDSGGTSIKKGIISNNIIDTYEGSWGIVLSVSGDSEDFIIASNIISNGNASDTGSSSAAINLSGGSGLVYGNITRNINRNALRIPSGTWDVYGNNLESNQWVYDIGESAIDCYFFLNRVKSTINNDPYGNVSPTILDNHIIIDGGQAGFRAKRRGFLPQIGTTANRPTTNLEVGQQYYDTDLNANVFWNGMEWVESVAWDEITGDQSDINLSGFTNDLSLNSLTDVDVDGGQSDKDILAWSSVDGYFTPVSHIGQGGSAHALATGSTAGFISGENQDYINNIKEVTAKFGTNFQTTKYFAENGSYQASGVTSLLPGFYVGSNVFSVAERDNNAIYEGTLWYRYTPTVGSTTDLEFTFAGNTHVIKQHTNEGAPTFHKYEFVIRFETSPAQYTIYVYDSDGTPFTVIEDESYINTGNQTFDIQIDKNDATSEVRVFKTDLKRIN